MSEDSDRLRRGLMKYSGLSATVASPTLGDDGQATSVVIDDRVPIQESAGVGVSVLNLATGESLADSK